MDHCDEECSNKGIPEHLHQLGREVDQNFAPDELLYRRFKFANADLTAVIKFNEMSVNRAKYCKDPDDVLWDDDVGGRHDGYGVVQFPVKALQGGWEHPATKDFPVTFRLNPEHKPLRCNYPHSEVIAMEFNRDTSVLAIVKDIKPTSVKMRIREDLRSLVTIALPNERSGESLAIK